MDTQLKKSLVVKSLQNWYIIDSVLFNTHARNVIQKGSVFKEYCSLKGSLLSNLHEYYMKIKFEPVNKDLPKSTKEIQETATLIAKKGKILSSSMLEKAPVKAKIKARIMSEAKKNKVKDLDKLGDRVLEERFKQFALDNCLIGLPLLESKKVNKKCDFNCQILEQAHKMMRDSLIRLAMTCKKVQLQEKFQKKKLEEDIKYSVAKRAAEELAKKLAKKGVPRDLIKKQMTKKFAQVLGRLRITSRL